MAVAAPEPIFRARSLSKTFGHVVALDRVDLDLHRGEIVGLIGDNGAGKSTLVKIIAGFHRPSQGTIEFEGHAARFRSAAEARRSGIETVHQDLGLVDSMSVARNFFLGVELHRGPLLDLPRMRRETTRMLSDIGLVNLRDAGQDVSLLSGGERQAICIGRAVAFQRKMLILDEPTSALSVKETDKVFEYMRQAKQRGLVVLAVMHNLVQITAIADRFVVFWHGRKVADVANTGQTERDLSDYILFGQPSSAASPGLEAGGAARGGDAVSRWPSQGGRGDSGR